MSYQVLARKWRPRTFNELVGQEHVQRALINALDNDRLHHAFLFTGTRGVGKTTIARILAKSFNCEQGLSSKPCGTCSACQEIDEGRFVDLIEVDAASRTKVEDTRDLLDNVQYAPTRARYKVYLIDEVHMLSTHSFNALLKTLEEPPPHVKFLLATTEPQKLPVTILSRCLQFNLRRLSVESIAEHLAFILSQEGIDNETAALNRLARAADGSMRDALSLLDQAIAYGGGKVSDEDVQAMLGSIDQGQVYTLLETLASGDSAALIQQLQELYQLSPDFSAVLGELLSILHCIALVQQIPQAYEASMGDEQRVRHLAEVLAAEDVQLYYQIGIMGQRDLPLAPDPRTGVEMVLLRMLAFRPADGMPVEGQGSMKAGDAKKIEASTMVQTGSRSPFEPTQGTPTAFEPQTAVSSVTKDWKKIIAALELSGVVQQLALNCAVVQHEDDSIHLVLDPSLSHLHTKEREARLRKALMEYYGRVLKLNIEHTDITRETPAAEDERLRTERQEAAIAAIENDDNVKDIIDTFDAQIIPNAIQPVD